MQSKSSILISSELYEDEEKANEEKAREKARQIEGEKESKGLLESQDPTKEKQVEEWIRLTLINKSANFWILM